MAPIIVPQREFATFEDFKEGENNFWWHFLIYNNEASRPNFRRERECFQRFQEKYSSFESQLSEKTTTAWRDYKSEKTGLHLPRELHYEAYQKMSQLVYATDSDLLFDLEHFETKNEKEDHVYNYLTK